MTDTVPEPVAQLIAATNSADLETFLDTFTSDGVVDDWGRTFRGRTEIRRWSDNEYLGKQVTLEVTSVQITPTEAIVVAQVGGNGFNGPSTFSFTLSGNKVQRMTIRE
ncbi:MAG: nuclear transport factor 2 family protein [Rhodococcus sp. (in: high G+C Gram-positive bacteria)]|nr:MAG: nuclear transport factor 2 family protein [Rhodococcus sp. (in: high G+C Gram-positive bacteria)]